MNLKVTCPNLDTLKSHAHGRTAGADASRIRLHLEQCGACRTAYDALMAPNTSTHANHLAAEVPRMSLSDDPPPMPTEQFSFLLPPVESDEIGRLGNYRVLRLLGQGGMGFVFLAEDIQLARPVALKVMRPELQGGTEGWQRFLREARAMGQIKHDHLVTIYQAGQENDVVYFAMELLDGESLDAWVRREASPNVAEIVRIAREIADGLAFLHQKNLLHRDIKPANIWLEHVPGRKAMGVPRVKILDLGLVRSMDEKAGLTQTGIVMGTPEFMAPEQARAQTVDARTDLFSLGGVLYYLSTRRKPFQGSTSVAVLMALASETPTPVGELNPRLPRAFADLVMQLLSRKPEQRPTSAAEVLHRLEAIEHDLGKFSKARATPISNAPDTQVVVPLDSDDAKPRKRVGIVFWIGVFVCFAFVGIGIGTVLLALRGSLFGPPPPAPPPPGKVLFLTELKDAKRENFPFKKGPDDKGPKEGKKKGPKDGPKKDGPGKDFDDHVVHKGQPIARGIFMHPPVPPHEGEPTSLTYHLDRQFKTFTALVSLRDGPERSETPCVFWVFGDGKELWKSQPVSTQADAQKCNVLVEGVDELRIAVTCAGPPIGAHAIWIDPQVRR